MHRFDLNQIAASPWKNGGGSTREIACWPPGAGMDAFAWRISVATIARDGPFSAFAGIDRQIMLLDGDGVHLKGDGVDHRLEQRWQPFAFSGDTALACTLLGGISTDFNVMARRGQWHARIAVVDEATTAGDCDAGLCMVLQGRWLADGALLAPGQGLWWSARQAAPLPLVPQGGDARLVRVQQQMA
ncbi:Various environmental stresses-induced protein [Delftia tsuruhatensis]|uniref:HutD/Ves family protein n=1 Tax=Delftia tsuruhatensis TaxID=180282 RepID=UPI001E72FA71|nr:HutD family protein [Delftia tsuruhatensis]CAB5681775.1 Various environmental stresses-induced protein [Delftia tsuruhatensis]CAC9675716.1 Various environmental stresses-induced protein [Delftia tsuruhatensis]